MQKEKGLVSVIIPVYNTGEILKDTVNSVLNQPYTNFEILLIDDGSPEATLKNVQLPDDSRIIKSAQKNQGMARTRNNGLAKAKGEFVFFLDHDDIIEPDFITERVNYLNDHPDVGFVGGPVQTFPDNPKEYMAAATNIEKQVLFLEGECLTTPSSYIIRNAVLENNNILLNEKLSSTADRFLLLQLSKVTHGATVNKGKLLYRISPGGFSQVLKPSLVYDNELFYYELKRNGLMPEKSTASFKSLYFWGLAGGFFKVKKHFTGIKYLASSFLSSPVTFLKIISKKII